MSADTLSSVLQTVRLRGAVFFLVEGVAPWVAEAPSSRAVADGVMPGAEHLIEFHVISQGSCWAGLIDVEPVRMHAGDVIIFPQGDPHVMSSAPGMRTRALIEEHRRLAHEQLPYFFNLGGSGSEKTQVICGFLGCDATPFNPLLMALPRMLHVPVGEAEGWTRQFIDLAIEESRHKRAGGEAVLARLSELMFVDVVRRYLDRLPAGGSGWLSGLRDRFVGRALALLHARPAEPWTIEGLAEEVGLSRSALAERFTQFVAQPPMQYLNRWRMQIAANLLAGGPLTVAAVAAEVGYDSEAAFSRAFKKATGTPPGEWRRARADAVSPQTRAR